MRAHKILKETYSTKTGFNLEPEAGYFPAQQAYLTVG